MKDADSFSEADSEPADQGINSILQNQNIYFSDGSYPTSISIVSRFNPINVIECY